MATVIAVEPNEPRGGGHEWEALITRDPDVAGGITAFAWGGRGQAAIAQCRRTTHGARGAATRPRPALKRVPWDPSHFRSLRCPRRWRQSLDPACPRATLQMQGHFDTLYPLLLSSRHRKRKERRRKVEKVKKRGKKKRRGKGKDMKKTKGES